MTPAAAGPFAPLVRGVVRKEMIQKANITLMTSQKRAPKVRLKSSQRIRIFEPATAWEDEIGTIGVQLAERTWLFPLNKAKKRLENGPDESLVSEAAVPEVPMPDEAAVR